MAVLKDLIVHGRSRFLNGINANSIKADEGIFNQLIAVDLKATDATIENLTATNARVTQTLTANHISTNTWEAASIANIGGNFYISPTGEQSGSINVTIDRTAAPGTDGGTYTLTFGVPSGSSGGFGVSSTSAAYWTNNARVMATGEVSYNNSKKYPLGTCSGTISGNVTASNNNITAITIAGVKSEALDVLFTDMGVVITASGGSLAGCVGYKLKISLYERYNSVYYPIGILLTSLGRNDKKQYIDIYGGSIKSGYDATGNVLNTGMAEPTLRIGELDGLPNIVTNGGNDTKPSGWGIYTTNGFFKGKIVSNAGIIANFTINGSKLYSNNHSTYNTAVSGIYIGDDYISFGSGGVTYFNTGGTGKIGPWTLSTTYFRNGNIANATNTTVSGVYLGTDGLNISNGTAATTSYITKSAVNIGNKLTWNGTTLSVTGAINATSLSTGTKTSSTSGTGTYIDSSGNIYSGSGSANNFTVTSTGTLTATGATINGTIKATSFSAYSDSTKRAEMTAQGLKIYDSDGTLICQFGSDNGAATIQLGKISGGHMYMSGTGGIQIYNSNISSNYISVISSGVTIVGKVESNTIKSKSVIDSNGLSVYKDDMTNSVANFGDTITLGATSGKHLVVNTDGLNFKTSSAITPLRMTYQQNSAGVNTFDMFTGSNATDNRSSRFMLQAGGKGATDQAYLAAKYSSSRHVSINLVASASSAYARLYGGDLQVYEGDVVIRGHTSAIGDYKVSEVSNKTTASSGTEGATGCSVTLGAGSWVVEYVVVFSAGSGTRSCSLYNGSTYIDYSRIRLAAATTGNTILNGIKILKLKTDSTINLYAGHAGISGAQGYNALLSAVRIA